jgi:hypothetical protein
MIDLFAVCFAQELVDIRLRNFVGGRIALCLNSPCLTVLMLEDEVDTAVTPPTAGIIPPEPNLFDLGGPFRICEQEPFNKLLELLAPLFRVGVERTV